MRYIVGLGNPGTDYSETRHNVGFHVVDALLKKSGAKRLRRKAGYAIAGVTLSNLKAALVKPTTYMNRSGVAVRNLMADAPGVRPEDLILVYDDVDLPLGRIRIRPGGSHGGHKGVLSILQALGTTEVARVRLGIQPLEGRQEDCIDFVLSRFTQEEEPLASEMIARGALAIEQILCSGLQEAMNLWNRASKQGEGGCTLDAGTAEAEHDLS